MANKDFHNRDTDPAGATPGKVEAAWSYELKIAVAARGLSRSALYTTAIAEVNRGSFLKR